MDGKTFGMGLEEGIHYIPNPLIDEGKPGSSIKQITTPQEMLGVFVRIIRLLIALTENGAPGYFGF
jgi:hypothetical protein